MDTLDNVAELSVNDRGSLSTTDMACEYVQRGFAPIPVPYQTKNPSASGWQHTRLTIDHCEQAFGGKGAQTNIGIVLGSASGNLVDVDLDSAEAVALAPAFLPPTGMIHGRASKPRSHWYYLTDTPMKRKALRGPAGESGSQTIVEIRGDGAQTIVPPSVHPSGERIEWTSFGQPANVNEAELTTTVQRLASAALLASHWRQGQRQDLALALSGALLRSGWDTVETEQFIRAVAGAAQDHEIDSRAGAVWDTADALDAGEPTTGPPTLSELLGSGVVAKITSWLNLQRTSPKVIESDPDLHLTDVGNAERFIARHGADMRYCEEWDKWLCWDGQRWQIDSSREVVRRAIDTVRFMYEEAATLSDDAKRRELVLHALNTEAQFRINAMVQLARALPGVPVETRMFDQHPFLLTVLNGTIDLKTGELHPHQRDHLITKLVPVTYDPAAQAPTWLSFLERIMNGNQSLIAFLQRAVGYSLTGVVSERALFILHGSGANGKTVFLQTIANLLGEYAMATPIETFMVKRDGAVPNDIARLRGARFVYASEADQGKRLSEATLKQLTGGDTVTARFMHRDFFEFEMTSKLWMGTNHKPEVVGTDNAIWDRIKLIPFAVTIPESERVPRHEFMQELRSELSGILNWALEGCLAWQRDGLGVPDEVRLKTNEYRGEMDVLAQWLDQCCVQSGAGRVPVADLYVSYRDWCFDIGDVPLSKQQFSQRMKERGFCTRRSGGRGNTEWYGIRLIEVDDELKELKRTEVDTLFALTSGERG